jgi:hypothetical protein
MYVRMLAAQPQTGTGGHGLGVGGQALDVTGAVQVAALNDTVGQRSIAYEPVSRDEMAEDQLRQIRLPGQPRVEHLGITRGRHIPRLRQLDESWKETAVR